MRKKQLQICSLLTGVFFLLGCITGNQITETQTDSAENIPYEQNHERDISKSIIGKWELTRYEDGDKEYNKRDYSQDDIGTFLLEFNNDGTVNRYLINAIDTEYDIDIMTLNYRISGNQLVIYEPSDPKNQNAAEMIIGYYDLETDTIVLINNESESFYFKKYSQNKAIPTEESRQTEKYAITADIFMTAAENQGFIVKDVLEEYSNVKFAVDVKLATHSNGWQILFLTMDTTENAHLYLNTMKTWLESQKTGAGSSQIAIYDSWGFYSQTNGGMYSYICQINNTMVYVPAVDDSHRADIEMFIKTIGY